MRNLELLSKWEDEKMEKCDSIGQSEALSIEILTRFEHVFSIRGNSPEKSRYEVIYNLSRFRNIIQR